MYSHCICSPETGITLFVNQRGYVHSEPPVILCTVVVVVDIAARRQRFRAASLLPRMMSANNGQGGEPTRRSAVQSPSPPDCDDVLVPLSFCVAPPTATAVIGGRHRLVIVPFLQTVAAIVLVLLHPPERTPIPDRIVTLVQGGKHTTTMAGSIGGVIRATYDARSKLGACVRPSSPPSMPSSIFSPSGSR
jgi:hypothetical protein